MQEGKFPIIIDGAVCGAVEVEKHGARTAVTASCCMREGIVRLSLYGDGGEGYLGVLAPEDGELRLKKTFTRAQERDFPELITQAGPAGMGRAPQEPEPNASTAPQTAPEPVTDWYAAPDGALVRAEGGEKLLALPEGDARLPPDVPGEERSIEGKKYFVFRARDII